MCGHVNDMGSKCPLGQMTIDDCTNSRFISCEHCWRPVVADVAFVSVGHNRKPYKTGRTN